MRRFRAVLLVLLSAGVLVCTRKNTVIEDSESDQAALLRSYRTLEAALEARDIALLDSVVDDGFLDEGKGKAALLAECAVYFSTYDSIDADLHLFSAFFRIERDQALVTNSLRLAARHATITDSVLIEWARGQGRWIRRDEGWKLYGDQTDGPGAEAVEVVNPADQTPLHLLAERVGAGLGIIDLVISTVLYDTAGHDALTGAGWPMVTRERRYQSSGGTAPAGSDSTTTLPVDTLEVWTIDFTGYTESINDGIAKSGQVTASMKSFNPDSLALNLAIELVNFRIGEQSISGSGTVSGKYRNAGDTLQAALTLNVQNLPVVFYGNAIVDRGTPTDRGDDDIRIETRPQAKSTCTVLNGITYAFCLFGSKPADPAYNLTLAEPGGGYAFGYDRYDTYPGRGYLFADSLSTAVLGYLAYADEIQKLRAAWINPATQAVWEDSVAVAYNDTTRHRVGQYGISGFLDDGQDVVLKEPAAITQESRAGHRFLAAVVFGYPNGTADSLAVIRLKDVNEDNDTIVDTVKSLVSFGTDGQL